MNSAMKMKIGVVGSRDFTQKTPVWTKLESLMNDLVDSAICIVSGGAKGVDSFAVEFAKINNLEYIEFVPDLSNCKQKFVYTKEYYERNQKIVDHSDRLVAFVTKDTGGTWDTIKRARKKGILVEIVYQ